MANKNATEISLMKGVSVKLNDDILFTVAYLVHTEPKARDKSEYLFSGRIDKAADLQAEADEMLKPENRLKPWTWKGLQKYDAVVYDKDSSNARGGRWLASKIKKAVTWDQFLKIADGWNEAKKTFNSNAKYAVDNYVTSSGVQIPDLKAAKDQLIKLVGQAIVHVRELKRHVASEVTKAEAAEAAVADVDETTEA